MNLFLSGKNNLVLATRTLIDGSTVNQSTARESTCVYKPIRGPGNRLHGRGDLHVKWAGMLVGNFELNR